MTRQIIAETCRGRDELDPWLEGYASYGQNLAITANPYSPETEAQSLWYAGWMEAAAAKTNRRPPVIPKHSMLQAG
jgi:hypothetical protein